MKEEETGIKVKRYVRTLVFVPWRVNGKLMCMALDSGTEYTPKGDGSMRRNLGRSGLILPAGSSFRCLCCISNRIFDGSWKLRLTVTNLPILAPSLIPSAAAATTAGTAGTVRGSRRTHVKLSQLSSLTFALLPREVR